LTQQLITVSLYFLDDMKIISTAIFGISLLAFSIGAATVRCQANTYIVERRDTFNLEISTDRSQDEPETNLVLRGISSGVAPQIEKSSCDGIVLKLVEKGSWRVPQGCRHISWIVPLERSGGAPYAQRSVILEDGFLLCEGSSIPRLQDANSVNHLKLPEGEIFPKATSNEVLLPPSNAPFLLTIFGNRPALQRHVGYIRLLYFLDKRSNRKQVADIDLHISAFKWLRDHFHSTQLSHFSVLWLANSSDVFSLGGFAGRDLLLVNYSDSKTVEPFGKAMRLYVPLHEAIHQFAASSKRRPPWYDESLASYFALRATIFATSNDPQAVAMFEKFKQDGSRFDLGLIPLDRRIADTGDVSAVAAFYTKGVAFWDAVNSALFDARGETLDDYMAALCSSNITDSESLPRFVQSIVRLPPERWRAISKHYLL